MRMMKKRLKGTIEIKLPPQRELTAEVTPYMKTNAGTIPSIIVDHTGVYLGSIKGRGNIVKVREGSLVKAFMPAGNSSMGLGSLNKQLASSSANEQAKAKEKFKKSMYGAADDGSSSDEEGASKIKRITLTYPLLTRSKLYLN